MQNRVDTKYFIQIESDCIWKLEAFQPHIMLVNIFPDFNMFITLFCGQMTWWMNWATAAKLNVLMKLILALLITSKYLP